MTPQRVTPMIPFDLQIHRLKTDSIFWDRVEEGRKTAEIRKNDRNYKRWDYLILERIKKHEPRLYAHKTVVVQITDIVTHEEYPDGLQPGYVMLSFRKVPGEVALLIERLDNQEDKMRAAIKSTENGCAYSKELMQRELDAKDRLIDALHAQQAARIKEQESKTAVDGWGHILTPERLEAQAHSRSCELVAELQDIINGPYSDSSKLAIAQAANCRLSDALQILQKENAELKAEIDKAKEERLQG